MIEQTFIPKILNEANEKKQKLEVFFDLREFQDKKWSIMKRMNYNKPDRIQKYLIEMEGLKLSSKKAKTGFENQFFTPELSSGNHYYDSNRELFLTKGLMQPVLRIIVYGEESLKREKLLNVSKLNDYLITGNM